MNQSSSKRRGAWLVFSFFVLFGLGLFLVPAFIIRPFRYQSPRALVWAISLRQWAPFWTLAAAVVAILAAWRLWPETRRLGKIALVAGLLLAGFSATMSRMNYFEWMFHPVAKPGFEATSQSKLDSDEMVLALAFNNDARAYPVREMAYHHIVNDVVGGVPVAVTY